MTKSGQVVDVESPIEDDEKDGDTGSGSSPEYKRLAQAAAQTATKQTPIDGRAHILNAGALADSLKGPGSLDPGLLAPPKNPDARRLLARQGIELEIPGPDKKSGGEWRYMGQLRDGRSLLFSSSANVDGHEISPSLWRLPNDLPPAQILTGYMEELEEQKLLGRVADYRRLEVEGTGGERIDGIVILGWGPQTPSGLVDVDPEARYLATDGTDRRTLSWRGIVRRNDETHLIIVSFSSPFETFLDARVLYDAILERLKIAG